MTEFELAELYLHRMDLMVGFAGLYFTLISAYLVVGYLVGDKLTTSQLLIISGLYLLWTAGLIHGVYNNYTDASALMVELKRLGSVMYQRPIESVRFATVVFLLVQITALIASLYFMWTVRHPKTK